MICSTTGSWFQIGHKTGCTRLTWCTTQLSWFKTLGWPGLRVDQPGLNLGQPVFKLSWPAMNLGWAGLMGQPPYNWVNHV